MEQKQTKLNRIVAETFPSLPVLLLMWQCHCTSNAFSMSKPKRNRTEPKHSRCIKSISSFQMIKWLGHSDDCVFCLQISFQFVCFRFLCANAKPSICSFWPFVRWVGRIVDRLSIHSEPMTFYDASTLVIFGHNHCWPLSFATFVIHYTICLTVYIL